MESSTLARCPVCGLNVPLDAASSTSGVVCPDCGTAFSARSHQQLDLVAHRVTLLLDHYEIKGLVHLSDEHHRFSDAWEALMKGARTFIPITEAEVRRPSSDVVARANFMQVQKSEIRGAVPDSEQV